MGPFHQSNLASDAALIMLSGLTHSFGYLFFGLMLIFPTALQEPRALFLILLIGFTLIGALNGGFRLYRPLAAWTLVCVTISLLFMTWGMLNEAPGALRVGTVYVLWPILFTWFVGFINQDSALIAYFKVLAWSVLAIEIMTVGFIANGLGFIELPFTFPEELTGAAFEIYEGRIAYSLHNISTLIYAVPAFTAYMFFYDAERDKRLLPLWLVITIVVLGWATMFLSGRRGFILVVMMSLPIMFGIALVMRNRYMTPRFLKLGAVGLFAFLLVANLADLKLMAIAEDFIDGFSFKDPSNEAAYDRGLQFAALLAAWQESPLIGHGHGAAGAILRDPEQPWAYELSYLALLFQTGLIGLAVYTTAVVWLVIRALKIVRHERKLALVVGCMLVGLCAFLIANATNPYLAKFDYLWTIFILVAAVNVAGLLRHS